MRMRYILCTVFAIASLTGCKPAVQQSSADATEQKSIKKHFSCDDGSVLDVTFDNDKNIAVIHQGEIDSILDGQVVASGYHYMNSKHNLRGKGTEAQYSFGRHAWTRCQEQ